jgi:hypothetical protein
MTPEDAPFNERVSTLLSKECNRGNIAHLESFESDRGRPKYV